jgi:hypothetical protein
LHIDISSPQDGIQNCQYNADSWLCEHVEALFVYWIVALVNSFRAVASQYTVHLLQGVLRAASLHSEVERSATNSSNCPFFAGDLQNAVCSVVRSSLISCVIEICFQDISKQNSVALTEVFFSTLQRSHYSFPSITETSADANITILTGLLGFWPLSNVRYSKEHSYITNSTDQLCSYLRISQHFMKRLGS